MQRDLIGLFRSIVQLETELWNRLEVRLQQAHGVQLASLEVMQVIRTTPGCRVLDVAGSLSITVGGASKMIDRLAAARLCRRQPNPSDARSQLIGLTATGTQLLAAANLTFETTMAELIGSSLSEDEIAGFAATAQTLRAHLIAADDQEPAARR